MPQVTYSYCPKYVQQLYPAGPTWKRVSPSDLSLDIFYGGWDSGMDGLLKNYRKAKLHSALCWGFGDFFPALPRGCWQHQLNHLILHVVMSSFVKA